MLYGHGHDSIELEDRSLALVRIVVINKFRRGESSMFDVAMRDSGGRRSYWMHPRVPLTFLFYGSRPVPNNRVWADALIAAANSPGGLVLVPEPGAESRPD